MKELNINARMLMFAVCSSIEFDLRKFIFENQTLVPISEILKNKAKTRNKSLVGKELTIHNSAFLNELDMGDLVEIIISDQHAFKLNDEKVSVLRTYFNKIIPVRNRVMHTRPLEVGDRSLLTEILQIISTDMSWINWNETLKTREKIRNKPHEIFNQSYKKVVDYDSNVYHNLPEPEFDDTGYIGRKKEIKEITELIKDKKNQIITIVGNGGIGKTATAVKALYSLIDDMSNPYESIIWVSLKTKTLSQGEFKNIDNAIQDLSSLFSSLEKQVVQENQTAKENIISFMKEFNTLLVLDNLETISTTEIIGFLKEIPENSKVVITSRHGLGELEYRYPLEGLDIKDAIMYFNILSRHYGLDLHKRHDKELGSLISKSLYSSPLTIKWFISGVYTGVSEKVILSNKNDLIIFCMSNVVDKLNTFEKRILQLLLIEGKKLSYGEIDYFLEYEENILIKSINKLITTSMIQLVKGEYELNQMAKDYLSISHPPLNEFINQIFKKRTTLNMMMQEIKIKNENDPFNPKSIYKNLESNNKKIASYYLIEALTHSSRKNMNESFRLIQKAISIAPDYFEVYKIKAFISAENGDWYEAINSYRIATESCGNNFEKATVLYLFSVFYTVRMENYDNARELIYEAVNLQPDSNTLQIEKARVLTYLGEFQEALGILESIKVDDSFTEKSHNLFISRFADLYRRMASNYNNRDFEKKFGYYKIAISKIESLKAIDTITYQTLSKILLDLSFLSRDKESMDLLYETILTHFDQLLGMTGNSIKKLSRNIEENKYEIPDNLYKLVKKLSINYVQEAKVIQSGNEGMVVRIINHFGFIQNKNKSLYFNTSQLKYHEPEVGDTVNFSVVENQRGPIAIEINLKNRFEIK